jgi:hypothetical protein
MNLIGTIALVCASVIVPLLVSQYDWKKKRGR